MKLTYFLLILQNFPYQIFLLAIVNVVLATVLSIYQIFLNANLSIFPL